MWLDIFFHWTAGIAEFSKSIFWNTGNVLDRPVQSGSHCHTELLSTWKVVSVREEQKFWFCVILVDLNLDSHVWLVVTGQEA